MNYPRPDILYTVWDHHEEEWAGNFCWREGTPPTFCLWDASNTLMTDGTLVGGPPTWQMIDGQGEYCGEIVESAETPVTISCTGWPNLTHQLR